MNKHYITVEDISINTPKSDIIKHRKRYLIKKDLGLVSTHYIDNKNVPKLNDPFSKHYKTINDYLKDRELAENLISRDKDIPEYLYKKLKDTAEEIKETYGYSII